ncbi:pimeloyl-ACP methyl ester carboxylesterase [Streptomyces sp. SAI-117]|uniref:alpha/beta fold hydrolase n=1 Tax=unclassified Streptomyces TaxID=2593676 RepID=UPI002477074D|nr:MULTISPECIES: alpha/beta hydrolase [unclassified Streptomyces]MDH6553691.1 pimeloyl-ACP methyl ester carboxylesterase [Streptomyces sp. SAI-041]MDH6572770.1 pimeloyl-ACP methyl ester carboxylesterase [Streptomyces sp. SAI-117]MDH6582268.1 pimeloyl-ACP methyl ester carboxylesterase [Streptomyces sp. SAI-133]
MTGIAPVRSPEDRQRRRRPMLSALVVGTLLAVPALSAATPAGSVSATNSATAPTTASTPRPTVVLVHGAFADSSSWDAVTSRLEDRGYPVIAVANPLRGLAGDSAYLSSVLDTIPGPIVLAGHSYGGAVITDAAVGHRNVKALVYIAAFAPDQGESSLEILGEYPGSRLPSALTVRPFPGGQDAYVNPADFRQVFAADVPARKVRLMAAGQRPAALAAFAEPSSSPAWKSIPSWFLVAGADRAVPPAAEQAMAVRAGSRTEVIRGASHAVLVSHPGATTRLIEAAARATS